MATAKENSLNGLVRDYTRRLADGRVQRAYRGVLAFMSDLQAGLEAQYPDHATSALYPGYLDMTYFAFTPADLKARRLKIAIVYLHAEGRFEAWLAGANRQVQADTARMLDGHDLGGYALSDIRPGVDAIIATVLDGQPDFDGAEALGRRLADGAMAFAHDMQSLLASATGSRFPGREGGRT